MKYLNLNSVTGIFIDGVGKDTEKIRELILRLNKKIKFNSIIHFSVDPIKDIADVCPFKINKLTYGEYSNFCLKNVYPFVGTEHTIWMHTDGFPLNTDNWTDDFFNYDYIGSPWPWSDYGGNGGFSFRTQKLMKLATKLPYTEYNEDAVICGIANKYFIDNGCIFSPKKIGIKWGLELDIPGETNTLNDKFGFHGSHRLENAKTLFFENFK
jgi:hypothetical protein